MAHECAGYHCAICGMWVTNWRAHAHANTEWGKQQDKLDELLARLTKLIDLLEGNIYEEISASPDR